MFAHFGAHFLLGACQNEVTRKNIKVEKRMYTIRLEVITSVYLIVGI